MPHSVVSEILIRFVGAVLYNTGRALVPFIAPGVGVEPIERQRPQNLWKWNSLTYTRGKERYFFAETVAIVGGAFWLLVAVLAGLVVWLA